MRLLNQKSPAWEQQWRPELDVTVAFNPRSFVVPITRIEGVTWTVLAPNAGDSIIAGQGSAVTLDGRYDAALPGSRSLFVQMGSCRRSGGRGNARRGIHAARAGHSRSSGTRAHWPKAPCCTPPAAKR